MYYFCVNVANFLFSVAVVTCSWKDEVRKWVGFVTHLRILAFIGPMPSKPNVWGLAPKAHCRWFQANGKKVTLWELEKASELERLCLLVWWYSPERFFFFSLLFLCQFLLYWGYKPTLFVFLSGLPTWSVNMSSCWQVNTFLQNLTEHKHPKAVYLIHQLMNFHVQHKTWLLFSGGQQFSIQSW